MGSKRAYLVILSRLIEACSEDRGITHIMMITGLNYPQTRKYLNEALSKGLVITVREGPDSRRLYRATIKGLRFTEVIHELERLLSNGPSRRANLRVKLINIKIGSNGVKILKMAPSSRRRDRLDINACILAKALKPSQSTELCNKCFISWVTCNRVINELLNLGLLRRTPYTTQRIFETTTLGQYYLTKYIEAVTMIGNLMFSKW